MGPGWPEFLQWARTFDPTDAEVTYLGPEHFCRIKNLTLGREAPEMACKGESCRKAAYCKPCATKVEFLTFMDSSFLWKRLLEPVLMNWAKCPPTAPGAKILPRKLSDPDYPIPKQLRKTDSSPSGGLLKRIPSSTCAPTIPDEDSGEEDAILLAVAQQVELALTQGTGQSSTTAM
jgi:hypothetical protein